MQQPSFERAPKRLASADDHARCREAIRTGSRSFFAASLLMPRAARAPAYALYAFCRLSDDAVDRAGLDLGPRDAVARLRERLDRAYAGRPADAPADRAFADLVADCAIPRALPDALLEGLEWDAEGRRYETLSDLRAYAARVAGAVGAMMTLMMGVRDPVALARATDLGVAMQLTNIARDVGEDARDGRVYLPLSWLREAGVDPDAFLAAPRAEPGVRATVARLLDAADALYRRAETGVASLPFGCRPAIMAARLIYAEIGEEVARRGCDSIAARAVVSRGRKARLAFAALGAAAGRAAPDPTSPLEETRYLVEEASRAPAPRVAPRRPLIERMDARIGRVLEMWERLDALERGDRRAVGDGHGQESP